MIKMDRQLQVDQQSLVSAWQERLPELMENGDSFSVQGMRPTRTVCLFISMQRDGRGIRWISAVPMWIAARLL